MTEKQRVLVVAPGRGTYNREELGYLARHHADKKALIATFDALRDEAGQERLNDLDGRESFQPREHTRGDNASPLIYAAAFMDFLSIDRERYEIVAVTGNSMGWYIALACAGVLSAEAGFNVVNRMGSFMQEALIGGQIVYPLVDENWQEIPGRRTVLEDLILEIDALEGHDLYLSIDLGGLLLFGGNEAALKALQERLANEQDRFPLRLLNHAAFHTPLQEPISKRARAQLSAALFQRPKLPLIDGRGKAWTTQGSKTSALWDYTLGHQVVAPYDFTKALQVGVKDYAPDRIIILGPGKTLGGAVAQSLIQMNWRGLASKEDFNTRQKSDPQVLAMGMAEQREMVLA